MIELRTSSFETLIAKRPLNRLQYANWKGGLMGALIVTQLTVNY